MTFPVLAPNERRVSVVRRHLKLNRGLAAWLVALTLAVRLLVPAGYMPMAGKAGLEICAGQTMGLAAEFTPDTAMAAMPNMGSSHASMPAHGAGHGTHSAGAGDHDCGFAAAVGGAGALPGLIVPAMPAPVALPVAFIRVFVLRPGLGLAAPPPPKTGPPNFLR